MNDNNKICSCKNITRIDILNYIVQEEKNKKYITRNPGGLIGIDKIIIINLKGSIRENNIRNQLNKLPNLIENEDYEFINPINFIIDDYDIENIFNDGIFNKNKLEEYWIDKNDGKIHKFFKNDKGELNKGTISLSLITYYIYLKAYLENKIFLILEDNIEFERKFFSKYNLFYKNLPQSNWFCLDLHTTNNHVYNSNYQKYYEEIKTKIDVDYKIPKYNNNWRPILNNYVYLGCDEGGGAKAYIIKPLSFLFINELPIIYAADKLKATISEYGNVGIVFVAIDNLIKYTDKYNNDRRNIDAGIIKNNYIKLDENYINNIIETVKNFNNYQYLEFQKIFDLLKI